MSEWFLSGHGQNSHGLLVHETQKYAVYQEWIYEWADFLNADNYAIFFWLDWYRTLWLLNAGGPQHLYFVFAGGAAVLWIIFARISRFFLIHTSGMNVCW